MLHDDLIGWTTMSRIQSISYTIPFVYWYDTCPRFDRRYPDTLFNIVTGKSLYSFRNSHHPVINSLVTLCTLWWCPTEWAQRYLSVTRSDKSQSRFVPTQQTLSEIPVVHLIATQLRCDLWYTQSIPTVSGSCTISWSKEMILDIRKALAYELHDLVLGLGLGLVHHIILLMMWSRYQRHPMSMVRKP